MKLMEIDLKDLKYIILKVLVFFGHGFNRFVLDMTLVVVKSDVFFWKSLHLMMRDIYVR